MCTHHRRALRSLPGVIGWIALLLLAGTPAAAQLISPGKLSRAHSEWEGITNCTTCHALGQRSADNARCLDCHTPLKSRIENDQGYHATVADQNCATCHKEHFGVDFIPVRLDTLTFEHDDTGFPLQGSHTETACRGCHTPEYIFAEDVRQFKGEHGALEKTFLGLFDSCIGCHLEESPHQDQFPDRECNDCHDAEVWEEAPVFDHDDTRFALIGKHSDVSCDGCHGTLRGPTGSEYVQYVNLDFATCQSCHEDVHDGGFGSDCASCHTPEDWGRLKRTLSASNFDHETTGFSLVGAHERAECSSCHGKPARRDDEIRITFIGNTDRNSFPRLRADNCLSCHVDYHNGELIDAPGGGAVCSNCHDQHEWFPTTYDIERHNREADYELTGSHMATPCIECHQKEDRSLTFTIENTACEDCHLDDNPHDDQFVDASGKTVCSTCHSTDTWQWASSAFDHDQTDFPLTGRHETVACVDCHPRQTLASGAIVQQFKDVDTTCESCHSEDDPHQGQFVDNTCDRCHNTEALTITEFNHDDTRFPLTGAHLQTACADCHFEETGPEQTPFIRFRPLGRECEDCHAGN